MKKLWFNKHDRIQRCVQGVYSKQGNRFTAQSTIGGKQHYIGIWYVWQARQRMLSSRTISLPSKQNIQRKKFQKYRKERLWSAPTRQVSMECPRTGMQRNSQQVSELMVNANTLNSDTCGVQQSDRQVSPTTRTKFYFPEEMPIEDQFSDDDG